MGRGAEEVRAAGHGVGYGPDRAVRTEQAVPCRPTCLASGPGTACSTGSCQPGPIPYVPGRAQTGPKNGSRAGLTGPCLMYIYRARYLGPSNLVLCVAWLERA
jgi:hypothetical protein